MVFAQVKDNIIQNTIKLDDLTLLPLFQINPRTGEEYDMVIRIDMTYPQPGIGWTFDNVQFNPPPEPEVIIEDPDV